LFSPYQEYITVDRLYGSQYSGFTVSQTIGNIVEGLLSVFAILKRDEPIGLLLAFITSVLTWFKTVVLYIPTAYFNGAFVTKDLTRFIVLWFLPTSAWIVLPFVAFVQLGALLMQRLEDKKKKK